MKTTDDPQTVPGTGANGTEQQPGAEPQATAPVATPGVTATSAATRESFVRRIASHALVLAAFVVVTIAATWPFLPRLGGYVVSKLDPLYSVWAMAWQAHALGTNPLGLFDTNIMYPFKGTLAFDELSFAEAVISAPLYWLSGNPVLSHNAQILLTFVLSGYGAWLLVRELTGSRTAGLVAGFAFAFSFYRMDHLPHMTLLSTEWLPFLLLSAYKLWWTANWRWAVALGAFFTVQALSSHYLAFYSAILLGLFALFYGIFDRGHLRWRMLGMGAAALFASLLLMLPVIVPYVQVQASHEFTRGLFEVERYSNTVASFLSVYQGNPIYRSLLSGFADPGPWPWERAAFPGLVVPVLGVAAIVLVGRRTRTPDAPRAGLRTHVGFYAMLAVLAAFLSLGPTLQITFAPSSYDPNAINGVMPLPYVLLHEWVPGFQSMRVVGRIMVLTTLGLSVLAGIGALLVSERLRARFRSRPVARTLAYSFMGVCALLPVVESWSAPLNFLEPIGTRGAVPPVYSWLASQPPTVVLEYPMVSYKHGADNVAMANTYQYYSAYNWQQEVNGSTTIRPASYSGLVHETEDCFPCPRSLDALRAIGVEYVVVHLDNLSDPQRTDFLWRSTNPVAKVAGDFEPVKEFGSDRVYRLKPREVENLTSLIPRGASVLLGDPYKDPIAVGDQNGYIGGGYMAALGWLLCEHPQYGDPRLSFGQTIKERGETDVPDYALLWAGQDPQLEGYQTGDKVWSNEFVTLYRRAPGSAQAGHTP